MTTGLEAVRYTDNRWHAVPPLFDGSPGRFTACGWQVNPPWERGAAWDHLDPTERCRKCERVLGSSSSRLS